MLKKTITILALATGVFFTGYAQTNAQSGNVAIEIADVNIPSIIMTGDIPITGSLINTGGDAIHSFTLIWNNNAEQLGIYNYSGLNIQAGEKFEFEHPASWTANPGNYDITISINNINGNVGESVTNSVTVPVAVASNSVQRKPLYEEFTSSTCDPCFFYNNQLYRPFFNTLDGDTYSLIKYHVNFPAPGDPYNIPDVNIRRSYYNIDAAPSMFREGERMFTGDYGSVASMQADFDIHREIPSYFDIDLETELDGTNIMVTVNTTPYISGTYRLYVAVIEKQTTENVATNGETKFEHVLMKMIPDGQGTEIEFIADQTDSRTFGPVDLSGTFIEEFDDLQVVVFIQNYETKELMQSENSGDALLTVKEVANKKLGIYPNPAKDQLKISSEKPVNIDIYDMNGQHLLSKKGVDRNDIINISQLEKGVYIVKINTGKNIVSKKLIIK